MRLINRIENLQYLIWWANLEKGADYTDAIRKDLAEYEKCFYSAAEWRGCVRPLEVREGSVGAAAGAGAPCLRDGCPARRPGQLRSAFRAHELYWLRTHEAIDGEMQQLKRR